MKAHRYMWKLHKIHKKIVWMNILDRMQIIMMWVILTWSLNATLAKYPALRGMRIIITARPAKQEGPMVSHRKYIVRPRSIGTDQSKVEYKYISWTFCASTDIRFTTCPVVVCFLAVLESFNAWNNYKNPKANPNCKIRYNLCPNRQ